MKNLFLPFIFLALQWNPLAIQAQNAVQPTIFELLSQKEAAKIGLELNMEALLKNRRTNATQDAVFTTEDGKAFKADVRIRGRFRRMKCETPPLRVKFSKKGLVSQGLDTLNNLGITMPCMDNDNGDDLVAKEYIAYRIFELLTPNSVKARLAKVSLKDPNGKKKKNMVCILIEDDNETARRLKGRSVVNFGVQTDSILHEQYALVVLFEYLIGNTDWDISMHRNLRYIVPENGGKPIVIPYDFDFSGLVAAPYASPSSESGLTHVRERRMMDTGLTEDELRKAANTIKNAEKEIMKLCDLEHLSSGAAEDARMFLKSFFEKLESSKDLPKKMNWDARQ